MVYLPPVFTETRPEILLAHIERHDFAVLVSHGSRGLAASRVPFLLERRAENLFLQAHLARQTRRSRTSPKPKRCLFCSKGRTPISRHDGMRQGRPCRPGTTPMSMPMGVRS